MKMASVSDIFDMGSPKMCGMISDYAEVFLVDNVVTTVPGTFDYTFCIPKECANEDFLDFAIGILNKIYALGICKLSWSPTFFYPKMNKGVCLFYWYVPDMYLA